MLIFPEPNWNKWNSIHELEIWQAAALSLIKAIEPDSIDMADRWQYMYINRAFFDMPKNYIDRLEVILSQIGHTLTHTKHGLNQWQSKVLLIDFVKWCQENSLEIPKQLIPNQALQKTSTDNIAPAEDTERYSTEKPITTTERTTLLIIIAALCNYSDVEYKERGVSVKISEMTDDIGAHVSDDAIREALKKIPDALKSRMK
jgi:hypothetical protein